jgi:DNA-binding response OmpR family regulator
VVRIFTVVDDSAEELEHTSQQILALAPGAEVIKATSGEAALETLFARRVVPSLIFLEFNLGSGMNGLQFLGRVRQARWLEGVQVAMLAEPVQDRDLVTFYRLGICSFLSKPVHGFELREAMRDFGQAARELKAASVVSSRPGAIRERWAA